MRVARDLFSNGEMAHASLQGQTDATRFVEGDFKRVTTSVARLCLTSDSRATDRQILFGHKVCQLDPFLRLSRDETTGYVGFVADHDLASWAEPTHRVQARSTLLFDAPDVKTPAPMPISSGSLLRVIDTQDRFARTHDGRYVPVHHLADLAQQEPDLAATAARLRDTPYLWGGNSAFGIDCSGLVQLACQAGHIPCPGDSDQQLAQLGASLPIGTRPQRNDVMFWKGHVALVYDGDTLIHANAHHMSVAFEPIQSAVERIKAQGDGDVLDHKRL